ncbi:polysaccharide deacetylase family protein [Paraflavitalea pollutisoli]|uniref:polysaccharide deacetylase family protein n=1 Tax=Paraflavitalea pollutisoli TaxID=3034143 RepID=UPI0023ED6B50|nr:polysaccharide deacetylase family protein [Paraflavitalea sp. H1-2-19X]
MTQVLLLLFTLAVMQQRPAVATPPVPILCYHNIRASLEGHRPDYTIDRERFRQHLQSLYDRGYHTITAHQLYQHLTHGTVLPEKPVMITFDDNRLEHFTVAAPILRQFGFTGVFFIMTVTIGKPGYMTAAQIKQLVGDGHTIGVHTWNHPDMRHLTQEQWRVQVDLPRQTLERITGQPAPYFAFPYGAWNEAALLQLKSRGMKLAFQLNGKTSSINALYTIRRLEVAGNWQPARLLQAMRSGQSGS